jgi:hypothetical protein
MPPDSTAFRVLDFIADSFDPILALFALAAPAIAHTARRWAARLRYYVALATGIAVVYLVQAADRRLGLWSALGLDYSTHSAFAASVATSAWFWRRRWLLPLLAGLGAYAALILLLRYHRALDILTAAAVALPTTAASHVLLGARAERIAP